HRGPKRTGRRPRIHANLLGLPIAVLSVSKGLVRDPALVRTHPSRVSSPRSGPPEGRGGGEPSILRGPRPRAKGLEGRSRLVMTLSNGPSLRTKIAQNMTLANNFR